MKELKDEVTRHTAIFFQKMIEKVNQYCTFNRGGSRAAATSKMERFVIIVNGSQLLTIITKRTILDVAAALDQPLIKNCKN